MDAHQTAIVNSIRMIADDALRSTMENESTLIGETSSYGRPLWPTSVDGATSAADSPHPVARERTVSYGRTPCSPSTAGTHISFDDAFELAVPTVRKRMVTGIKDEPDPDLRDTEQIPLTESVEDFMAREVLPYAPDAWVAEVMADVLALERETDGLLEQILVEVE